MYYYRFRNPFQTTTGDHSYRCRLEPGSKNAEDPNSKGAVPKKGTQEICR